MQADIDLSTLASRALLEKGLEPEFSSEALNELESIHSPAISNPNHLDLRSLLWCSIDNDDSRDLDQLTYAEKGTDGKITLWIAIADVDALVKKDSPLDQHARINTRSVYTPTKIFPMLPEKLSTDFTSLNENEDRLALVIKIQMNLNGEIEDSSIFQASVHNYAKLTYRSIGEWLEGKTPLPDKVSKIQELENILKVQHEAAQILKQKRHSAGSLTLESSEAEVKLLNSDEMQIQLPSHNFAHQIIEELMIGSNTVMAKHLSNAKVPSLRRVVRTPKYWDQIIEIAKEYEENLPKQPDPAALEAFLVKRKKADPISFPDLSLTIIKLLGRGEYVVENDPKKSTRHFSLALSEYTHSTAPNRRFPDLITLRQYKAFSKNEPLPYTLQELYQLADHCTNQEEAVTKVERQINKSAAAKLLGSQIGAIFKGIVTGANQKGTWVRIFEPAVEGKLVHGFEKLKVGDLITVQLKNVDIPKGFIDFTKVGKIDKSKP